MILNCPDDAFSTALRTLSDRGDRSARPVPEVRDWLEAQIAVFKNCSSDQGVVLPEPAPAAAAAIIRADRAYQTAAAYFYGMRFDEAERRFRAIGEDRASPWRHYGRYLAARCLIRRATVTEQDQSQSASMLSNAEAELQAVIDDPEAASLHHSARGLLDHLAARLHPVDRLHAVSRVVAESASPTEQDVIDYRWLMDRLIGDTVTMPTAPSSSGKRSSRTSSTTGSWPRREATGGAGARAESVGRQALVALAGAGHVENRTGSPARGERPAGRARRGQHSGGVSDHRISSSAAVDSNGQIGRGASRSRRPASRDLRQGFKSRR